MTELVLDVHSQYDMKENKSISGQGIKKYAEPVRLCVVESRAREPEQTW